MIGIRDLCRGDADRIRAGMRNSGEWIRGCLFWILLGGATYGFTLGMWQWGTPQPVYGAIKVPLLFFLVAVGNAVLNGMLAQLIGLPLTFRESMAAILGSFAIAALILGSLSPAIAFWTLNMPGRIEAAGRIGYSVTMVFHVALIAFAGGMANLRLYGLLCRIAPSRRVVWRGLIAWLAGNLLLGSQLSWILRPFIGSPLLKVAFLRPDAFRGSFFEALWSSLRVLMLN